MGEKNLNQVFCCPLLCKNINNNIEKTDWLLTIVESSCLGYPLFFSSFIKATDK